ncbi:hypothetical protein Mapa_003200 [Marchantia paleacea]|nr:hypothetical protein Mapa_003200 [Marchantia paleacea]
MTSSFIVNLKGATHTSAPAPVKNASPCFDLSGKESSRRAAEIRGTKPAAVKVGLRRSASLSDTTGSSGAGQARGSASLPCLLDSVFSSSRISSRAESARGTSTSSTKARAHRSSDSERRCYPATEREPVTGGEKAEASGGEFGFRSSYGLSKLSHFLRELARQDCWAGLLEPFQGAGNLSPGNYSFQELKRRSPVSSTKTMMPSNLTSPGYNPCSPAAEKEQEQNEVREQEQSSISGSTDTSALLAAYLPDSDLLSAASTKLQGTHDARVGESANGTARANVLGPKSAEVSGPSERIWIHDEKPQAELCRKSATCVTAEDIGSCENLALWLEERIGSSVVRQWGNAAATKRVSNLWCELVEGEISLEDSRPPKRTAHVASVKIRNEQGHVLVEAYQQMADGRVRPRNRPLSEKMRPGEHVEEACLRGIFEELGCQMGARERVVMVPESYRREEEERESFSYPGLPTRYVIHTMVAHIEHLPSTEFSTDEDESGHGSIGLGASSDGGAAGVNRSAGAAGVAPVGVKRHFWKWIPENQLADFCRR